MPFLPVSQAEFTQAMDAFASFENKPTLAIALSGGIDSMALALLARQWVKERGGRLAALTVDHGLRTESKNEAMRVQMYCRKLNIEHHTLTWHPTAKPASGVQASARDARYRLLAQWCKAHDALHLLTAHHQDDQAETLFFRLGRGSGLDGLACMSAISFKQGVRILRPLLEFPKARLEATLQAVNQPWVEDPTNSKQDYTRNYLRQQLRQTGNAEAFCQQASNLAKRLGVIRNHMENQLASCLTQAVSIYPEGYGTIHMPSFAQLPAEYGIKALSALLATVGGHEYHLRSEQIQRLYDQIAQGHISRRRTLGGLQIVWKEKSGQFYVFREANALGQAVSLPLHTPVLWDGRFILKHAHTTPLTGQALGVGGSAMVKNLLPKRNNLPELAILSCLPAFWHLETLVSVPHIGYCNPDYRQAQCMARFHPVKALAAPAFFSMNRVA